jgi:hypothetical protein
VLRLIVTALVEIQRGIFICREFELKDVLNHNHKLHVCDYRDPKPFGGARDGQHSPQEHEEGERHREDGSVIDVVYDHDGVAEEIGVGEESVIQRDEDLY